MFKYTGAICPICNKELLKTDEIAVCPECGAPYHKSCVKESGCILNELHEKGEIWKSPANINDDQYIRCNNCGTPNPPETTNCTLCKASLNNEKKDSSDNDRFTVNNIPLNSLFDPLGGVSPDEEIDKIPAKDLALFVKTNTRYYIPRFKAAAENRRTGPNWAAFFFEFYFFIYRKMWGVAAIVFVISLILSLPSLYIFKDMFFYGNVQTELPANFEIISNICSFLSFAVKLLFSFFANKLYANKVFKSVHKIRKEKKDDPDYTKILTSKGGTSKLALILSFVIPYALTMILSFVYITLS